MSSWKFTHWCKEATDQIKYPPDRDMVFQELKQHIDDRYESFLDRGLSSEDAVEHTLQAMGNASDLAPQLAAIHRPFWGFAYSISRLVFRIAVIVVLLFFIRTAVSGTFSFSGTDGWDPFEDPTFIGAERTHYVEPHVHYSDSGYRYTLTKAVVWESPERDSADLFFQIRVQSFLPGAKCPRIGDFLWADDNLGNYYYTGHEGQYINPDHTVMGTYMQINPITWVYEMHIYDFAAQGVEWVDIHYSRDGRNMVLRLDITGGVDA